MGDVFNIYKRPYFPKDSKDKSDLDVSEEILMGLRRKMESRLLLCHTQEYVNEIMGVVDNIIIEASYMGVNCHINKNTKFIVRAIEKRRKL